MATNPRIIRVTPGSELAEIVDESANTAIVIERDGRRFRLVPDDAARLAETYDPDRVLDAIERATGIFAGMDVERLKAELREQRVQDELDRPA
jgi:hypothetical protein